LDEYRRHLLERERGEERWVTGTPTHPLPHHCLALPSSLADTHSWR
jgi:hypothetical protein